MAKAREIEGFFSKPKEYTTQEVPRGRKSFLKPPTQDETSPISLFRPQAMGRKYSNSKSPTVKEENSNYLSPFVSTQNKPIEALVKKK